MKILKTTLALMVVLLASVAWAGEGLTEKQVESFYKKLGKLSNKGELREMAKLYHPDYELVDEVSGTKPLRYNRVSYFKEAVALQARVSRWRFEYEITSISVAPDGASAEVVSVHTNTLEGGGKSQTSRTVQKATIISSESGPLVRHTEVLESKLVSGGA